MGVTTVATTTDPMNCAGAGEQLGAPDPRAARPIVYENLRTAGIALCDALAGHRRRPDAIVLGLARGGVPAAAEVALGLDLPLDVVVTRGMVQRDGVVRGASVVAGRLVVDVQVQRISVNEPASIEAIHVETALIALADRNDACRGELPPRAIVGMTVLLVDNGIHTGGTVARALSAVRALAPARIVVAVPTAASNALERIRPLADEVICLHTADVYPHVGYFYRSFVSPDHSEIARIVDRCANRND
jgi:putative phosphoribosyl transferase